jgi:hypothetical protein
VALLLLFMLLVLLAVGLLVLLVTALLLVLEAAAEAAAVVVAGCFLRGPVSSPCTISLWLMTSTGTITIWVEREAAAPARKLLVAASVVGDSSACWPAF